MNTDQNGERICKRVQQVQPGVWERTVWWGTGHLGCANIRTYFYATRAAAANNGNIADELGSSGRISFFQSDAALAKLQAEAQQECEARRRSFYAMDAKRMLASA